MQLFGRPVYWRETHLAPRFLFFDARLVILVLFTAMHIAIWTVSITIIAILVASIFERKGVSLDSILRFMRAKLVGKRRPARRPGLDRPPVDFGFETQERIDAYVARETMARQARAAAREKALKKRKAKGGRS